MSTVQVSEMETSDAINQLLQDLGVLDSQGQDIVNDPPSTPLNKKKIENDAIRQILRELEALTKQEEQEPPNDNAVFPVPTTSQSVEKTENDGDTSVRWPVQPMKDSPFVSWTDGGYEFTIQNPANRGVNLIKMHMFDQGRITHGCAMYLDSHNNPDHREIYNDLVSVFNRMKDLWFDSSTGRDKAEGLGKSATPLPAWRVVNDINKPVTAVKKTKTRPKRRPDNKRRRTS